MKSAGKNVGGFTLLEIMVAVAIGAIVSLAMASVFTFSAQQFQALIDQNEAEESLLLASFNLRATLSQAVRTVAVTGIDPSAIVAATSVPPMGTLVGPFGNACTNAACAAGLWPPDGTAIGFMRTDLQCDANCANGGGWLGAGYAAGSIQTLALFIRENGEPTVLNPVSRFVPTGIFYRLPNVAAADINQRSGKIYIAQVPFSGGSFVLNDDPTVANSIATGYAFDRVVAFGVSQTNPANCTMAGFNNALQCINFFIRTRYFKGTNNTHDYSPNEATATGMYRDIDMTVNINLRDNVIGAATTSVSGHFERLYGGLYFYRFQAPTLSEF